MFIFSIYYFFKCSPRAQKAITATNDVFLYWICTSMKDSLIKSWGWYNTAKLFPASAVHSCKSYHSLKNCTGSHTFPWEYLVLHRFVHKVISLCLVPFQVWMPIKALNSVCLAWEPTRIAKLLLSVPPESAFIMIQPHNDTRVVMTFL